MREQKKQRIERKETGKKKGKGKNKEKECLEELIGNEKNRVGTLKREGKYGGVLGRKGEKRNTGKRKENREERIKKQRRRNRGRENA